MELASASGFERNREQVIEWYDWRRKQIAAATPNAAHRVLASRREWIHVTQNVDELLERAGAPAQRVLHLHGRIDIDRCHDSECSHEELIDLAQPRGLRPCPRCGAFLRPGVVWFGEMLPEHTWRRAIEAINACEVMLVIGTSGTVYPAAGLVDEARAHGARIVVINTDPPPSVDPHDDLYLTGSADALLPHLLSQIA